VEVWLGTTAEYAQQMTSLPISSFTATAGGVTMRSAVTDLQAAAHDLASLGVRLAIHHPPELRDHLRRYAETLARDAERQSINDE
jgi:hypothetical protein